MNFAKYLRKSDVSENSKVYMVDIYEMDFMKGIVILVKVDEMYKILKSPLANHFWSKGGSE